MVYKKGISSIITISLLLVVSVGIYLTVQSWYLDYQDELELKVKSKKLDDYFEILKIDNTTIYLNNQYKNDFNVTSLRIGPNVCRLKDPILTSGYNELNIGSCTSGLLNMKPYEVVLLSNDGIVEKTDLVRNPLENAFISKFTFDACNISDGFVRVYGLSALDNAHAEISSSNSFTYHLCLKHIDYTLGTTSTGNSINLFYLLNQTNSAIFTSKGSIYSVPSNWYNVTLSSDGGIFDLKINSSDLGVNGYICLGKIDQDDIYGAHIGDCTSSLPDTIWLKLSE